MRSVFLSEKKNKEFNCVNQDTIEICSLADQPITIDESTIDEFLSTPDVEEIEVNMNEIKAFIVQHRTFKVQYYKIFNYIPNAPCELKNDLYFLARMIVNAYPSNPLLYNVALDLVQQEFEEDSSHPQFIYLLIGLVSHTMREAEELNEALSLDRYISKLIDKQKISPEIIELAMNIEEEQLLPPGYYIEPLLEVFSNSDNQVQVQIYEYVTICCEDLNAQPYILDFLAVLIEPLKEKNVELWMSFLIMFDYLCSGEAAILEELAECIRTFDIMSLLYEGLTFNNSSVEYRAIECVKTIAIGLPDMLIEEDLIENVILSYVLSMKPTIWTSSLNTLLVFSRKYGTIYGIDVLESKRRVENAEQLITIAQFLDCEFALDITLISKFESRFPDIIENFNNADSAEIIRDFLFKYSLLNDISDDDLLTLK